MEAMISALLNRFEKGSLSRRELIQGLAMLTAAGGAASAAPAPRSDGAPGSTPHLISLWWTSR